MIVDDCIFPLHERHDNKSLCHFDATKAMCTLHRLVCRVDMKNIPGMKTHGPETEQLV